jgi:hypothetical protein
VRKVAGVASIPASGPLRGDPRPRSGIRKHNGRHPRVISAAVRYCPILTSQLALTPGTSLGVHDITAPIGEGSADAVVSARDADRDARRDQQASHRNLKTM